MRLIDADELIVMEYGGIKFIPVEFINDAPTIDAVPVVRCKDCKHTLRSKDGKIVCCLTKMVGTTKPNWFCADGEREDDETD